MSYDESKNKQLQFVLLIIFFIYELLIIFVHLKIELVR